jgi:DNA repair exonuclease SbcCD ATPase subunit
MDDDIRLQVNENKSVSLEIGYIVPFWSSKPLHKYSLDIWREGTILDTIDISKKEFYIIGRNKNICDIYMNNMTVSRTHCVIQHKDDGEIFLYDLDSVYGTSINKRPIPKKTYVKLNVGDTFKIGSSSKMFILNGPAELLPDESEQPIKQSISNKQIVEKRISQIKSLHEERENYKRSILGLDKEDIDWGQKDYDEEIMNDQMEEENNEANANDEDFFGITNLEEIKDRSKLTEKQRNMLDKIDSFKKGILKIKEEIIKIKKKEEDNGELTEGQKKRLENLDKKMTELSEKLETQEDGLRISLSSKDGFGGNETRFNRNYVKELNSDEDEFFDRSRIIRKDKPIQEHKEVVTENYETLKSKLEDLIRNRQRLVDKLQKVDSGKRKEEEELDPLDKYFKETENKIQSDDKTKLTQQITDLAKEITKTQKLISLVTPSHIKIKYKDEHEQLRQQARSIPNPDLKNDEIHDDKKRKKMTSMVDTIQQFTKLKKKVSLQKHVDSDDEIIEEMNNYQESLGREVNDADFMQKKEEFKKALIKAKEEFENQEEEQSGGLIKSSNKNYFEEIIENIGEEFNPNKYAGIQTALDKKDRGQQFNIDFSVGGLQSFDGSNKAVKGDSELLQRKRDRPEYEGQKIVYGPTMRPEDRHKTEMGDEEYDDFDPTSRFKREHDISGNPYYNKTDY